MNGIQSIACTENKIYKIDNENRFMRSKSDKISHYIHYTSYRSKN